MPERNEKAARAKLVEAGQLLRGNRCPSNEERGTRLVYEAICAAAGVEPYADAAPETAEPKTEAPKL